MAIKINGITVIDDSRAGNLSSAVATGNVSGGNLVTTGVVSATGNVTTGAQVVATGNVSGSNLNTAGVVSATGNITGGNLNTGAQVVATGNVSGGNLTTAGAVTASTVTASGNVSGGNLVTTGAMSVTGNVSGGNLTTAGQVVATGNVSGGNLTTAGVVSATGNVTGGNLNTAGQVVATGNVTGGNLRTANITVATDSIVSTHSVITIDPSAAGATGTVVIAGNLSVQGTTTTFDSTTVTVNDLQFNVANNASTASAANDAGIGVGPVGSEYAKWIYQNVPNVWSTAIGITATGNITGGNLNTAGSVTGNGRALTSISASNIDTGTLAQARLANASLTVNGVSITLGASGNVNTVNALTVNNSGTGAASGTTFNGSSAVTISHNSIGAAPQAGNSSITTVGALNSGSITSGFGTIDIGTDTVTCGGIINANANGVGNIGSSTTYFNTIFARATSAQYADLAEMYEADAAYEPGTVVSFGGDKEVTASTQENDARIAGVISTAPSYIMNSALESEHTAAVALTGRVPTRVTGTVRKGDMMVSAGDGTARACAAPTIGSVIGKALEDFSGASGVIEVVVGRL